MHDRSSDIFKVVSDALQSVTPEVIEIWQEHDAILDEREPGRRARFLYVLSEWLSKISRSDKHHRIEVWTETLYRARQLSWYWNSDRRMQYLGSTKALKELADVARLISVLKAKLGNL